MTSRLGFCPLVKFRCGAGVGPCRVSRMTRRIGAILGVLGVLSTACGGAATPEPAEPTSEAAPDTESEPAAAAEAPSETASEAAAPSGEANTDVAQVQEVLQLVLDDEALNPY